jgi:hypothetical protein
MFFCGLMVSACAGLFWVNLQTLRRNIIAPNPSGGKP